MPPEDVKPTDTKPADTTPAKPADVTPVAPVNTDNMVSIEVLKSIQAETTKLKEMLDQANREKAQIQFDSFKEKSKKEFGIDDKAFDLLAIDVNTAQDKATEKLKAFAEYVKPAKDEADKDDKVFMETNTKKTGTDDKNEKLISEGKFQEALANQLSQMFKK